jgi:UDP-glucose 4-epimerase
MSHYNNKVVLIGGSGFLGKNLKAMLKKNNTEYISTSSIDLDLSNNKHIENFRNLNNSENCTIIFLSALTPDKGKTIDIFNKNIQMAQNFLTIFDNNFSENNHVIYVSSDAVYSLSEENIKFNTLPSPTDLYSSMHLTREIIFKSVFEKNLTIIRPTLIYGFGDTHNSYGPNRFFRQMIEKNEINIFGEGLDVRDHLYIRDFCNLINCIIINKKFGILNLASGNSISYIDLAKIFIKNFSKIKINKIKVNNKKTVRYFEIENFLNQMNYRISNLEDNIIDYYRLLKAN